MQGGCSTTAFPARCVPFLHSGTPALSLEKEENQWVLADMGVRERCYASRRKWTRSREAHQGGLLLERLQNRKHQAAMRMGTSAKSSRAPHPHPPRNQGRPCLARSSWRICPRARFCRQAQNRNQVFHGNNETSPRPLLLVHKQLMPSHPSWGLKDPLTDRPQRHGQESIPSENSECLVPCGSQCLLESACSAHHAFEKSL